MEKKSFHKRIWKDLFRHGRMETRSKVHGFNVLIEAKRGKMSKFNWISCDNTTICFLVRWFSCLDMTIPLIALNLNKYDGAWSWDSKTALHEMTKFHRLVVRHPVMLCWGRFCRFDMLYILCFLSLAFLAFWIINYSHEIFPSRPATSRFWFAPESSLTHQAY